MNPAAAEMLHSCVARVESASIGRLAGTLLGLDFRRRIRDALMLADDDLSTPLPIPDFGDASRSTAQAACMSALHRTAQHWCRCARPSPKRWRIAATDIDRRVRAARRPGR